MDRLRRLFFDHRRLLASVLVALAVLSAVSAVRADAPPSTGLLVAARDLPSGSTLTRDDVEEIRVDPRAVPDGATTAAEALPGAQVAGPMRRGEAFTDARLLGPGVLVGRPAGTVVATVRVADPLEVQALSVGDLADVVAVTRDREGGGARAVVVGEALEVVATTTDTGDPTAPATVRVLTDRDEAAALAAASEDARLSVVATAPPGDEDP